jgi:hypothetical protein
VSVHEPGGAGNIAVDEGGDQPVLRVDGERPTLFGDQLADKAAFAVPPPFGATVDRFAGQQKFAGMAE